jgi:CheY-like chemotaxis protein
MKRPPTNISSLLRATSTSGNTVHELNFRPALEVSAELIKSEFNADIDPDDLIDTASILPMDSKLTRQPCLAAGMDVVLFKPFSKHDLIDTLLLWAGRKL